jgi:predicted RNA-binding protein YlxR (DUF448 family)
VVADASGRAAGRGAYICRTEACLDRAIAKGTLSRALKTPLPPELRAALAGSVMTQITHTNETMTIEGGTRGQE